MSRTPGNATAEAWTVSLELDQLDADRNRLVGVKGGGPRRDEIDRLIWKKKSEFPAKANPNID